MELEQQLARQETIWAGLYGPIRAGELVSVLRRRLGEEPAADIAKLVDELDPPDEDWEEGGLSRPGVG